MKIDTLKKFGPKNTVLFYLTKLLKIYLYNKIVGLICKSSVSVSKKYNVKRLYETQHPASTKLNDENRSTKFSTLQRELIGKICLQNQFKMLK